MKSTMYVVIGVMHKCYLSYAHILTFALGHRLGYRSHRMYPFRSLVCRWQEGPTHGQE